MYDALTWRHIDHSEEGDPVPSVVFLESHCYTIKELLEEVCGRLPMEGKAGRISQNDSLEAVSVLSVSVLAIPMIIYVGGGEQTLRGNVSYGYGVWKSVDAGKTWKQMGLEQSRHIARITVHPQNPDIVFAAAIGDIYKSGTERGVFKSIDGGDNWKKVLFANKDAGACDLVIDPGNHRIMYASTWNVRRTPHSFSSGGKGSALWKSIDGGDNWSNISAKAGLPKGKWGISGIAVSPVNSDRLYAIIENKNGGVFRSDDGGENWKKTNSDRSLRQRAWYYTKIYAGTGSIDDVHIMNVGYFQSGDGGKTFSRYQTPHGDHHDLWIDPNNDQRMIIADDGGAQVSTDKGENWTTYYNQPTAQFLSGDRR